MGFFAEFSAWLNALLAGYIGGTTARIAGLLEPMIVTLGVLYVMVWGYLQLCGRIDEPLIHGLRRLVTLAVVLGVALHLWLYHTVIVDTVFAGPAALAAGVVGAFDSVGIVDEILYSGSDAAESLYEKAGLLDGLSFYIAGSAVYVIVGLTAVYTMFLLALSKIALSVLLALGPLFIALTLFETTKRFFEAWIAQLLNYAFITVLTVLTAALMMQLIRVAAAQAAAMGDGIQVAHAVRVCLAAGLVFLVMRQVMPMAAGLASGLSLSTFGVLTAAVMWGLGRASRNTGQFVRGALLDRDTGRYDSLSRRTGYALGQGVAHAASRLLPRPLNSIRDR
jgi:type IV secretion system protein VirB6